MAPQQGSNRYNVGWKNWLIIWSVCSMVVGGVTVSAWLTTGESEQTIAFGGLTAFFVYLAGLYTGAGIIYKRTTKVRELLWTVFSISLSMSFVMGLLTGLRFGWTGGVLMGVASFIGWSLLGLLFISDRLYNVAREKGWLKNKQTS